MRTIVGRKFWKLVCVAICAGMLWNSAATAGAATQAIYEYEAELGDSNVYRGVVNTSGLNVRSKAGREHPIVQLDGQDVKLDNKDEVAILEQIVDSGEVWYRVSFQKGEAIVIGYVHSGYINLTVDVLTPLPTPTPIPTLTPTPKPTPTPAPTQAPTPTPAPEPKENDSSGGIIALVVAALIAAGILVALWYLKKRNENGEGVNTSEKLDNLKNAPRVNAPLSKDGTPIPVRKRRDTFVNEEEEDIKRVPVERQDEASLLADKDRARRMNEEMIRQNRNREDSEEEELREIAANLKEKEILKDEIERLRIGDMVYHEYFGKGIVRDNTDVKVIEISFGQDVRFLNKQSCVSKKLLRKL